MAVDIKKSVADPVAVDTGNVGIQGRVVSKTVQFALFTQNRNAVWGGRQQLIKASYPFAVINFPANRNIFKYEAGDCFRFSYAAYGISNMICRVVQLEEEELESENIIVYAMEDVFSVANAITEYTDPTRLAIPAPDYTVLPFDHQRALEAPYAMSSSVMLLPVACRKSDRDLGFGVYMSIDGGASYFVLGVANNIRPYGVLVGSYPIDTYTIDEGVGFTIEFDNDDVDQVQTVTWPEVFSGQKNTGLLGNEIISFQSITPISGDQYKLEGIIRGRFGTVKEAHLAGEEFYVINFTSKLFSHQEIRAGAERKFKYLPYNVQQTAAIADCTAIDLSIEGECLKPYIPINFDANGSGFAARYDIDITLTWSPRYRGKGAGVGIPGIVLSDSDREGYFIIEVWVNGVKVRTTNSIDDVTWAYTEAMNLVDNGTLPDSLTFKLSNYRNEGGVLYKSDQAIVACEKNPVPSS